MAAERLTPKILGKLLQQKRGSMGLRAAAAEIGISLSTLSRIENGRIPDLETLRKVCLWLGIDPADYLGSAPDASAANEASLQVIFKRDHAVSQETSKSLGKLIVAAYQQFAKIDAAGHQ